MKIIVFGASGSGTTTLAHSLAERLNYTHLDVDEFYWVKTEVPYQIKIARGQRIQNLRKALALTENAVVSGSLVNWGEYWSNAFDFAIFLQIPKLIRMERLIEREERRYGDKLKTDPDLKDQSQAFLNWAKSYDDPTFDGRNIAEDKKWSRSLSCECMELGNQSVNEWIEQVLERLKTKNPR